MLDAAGLSGVQIFASSELDEYEIAALVSQGAPIDGFGVGTKMAVSDDVSHLDMAYKLVEYAGRGRTKLSPKKALYPGRKQIFREAQGGQFVRDCIGRHDEKLPGQPLLVCVMRGGQRQADGCASLEDARRRASRELCERLPVHFRRLEAADEPYPVAVSAALERDHALLCESIRRCAKMEIAAKAR
jgi:nicotinate phosphoribosyltransferase